VGVAGNLAFKQNATLAGDLGTQAAITWILSQSTANLDSDTPANAASGYLASWQQGFDPLTFNWGNTNPTAGPVPVLVPVPVPVPDTGNTVSYIIHRLCKASGVATSSPVQECAMSGIVSGSNVQGNAGSVQATPSSPPLFRITTRVVGPRGTLSYIQVVVE
jgi:hypothetical protein